MFSSFYPWRRKTASYCVPDAVFFTNDFVLLGGTNDRAACARGQSRALRGAVYAGRTRSISAQAFNARAEAGNFGPDELERAFSFCRTYGVKAYITLNTLVSDRELPTRSRPHRRPVRARRAGRAHRAGPRAGRRAAPPLSRAAAARRRR